MVEVVGRALGDGLLRPGAGKGGALHDQDVDLIAFPGEGTAVVRARGEQAIDVAPVMITDSATEQAPLMDTQGLNPERHLAERGPEVEGNHQAAVFRGCTRDRYCSGGDGLERLGLVKDAPLAGASIADGHLDGFGDRGNGSLVSVNERLGIALVFTG